MRPFGYADDGDLGELSGYLAEFGLLGSLGAAPKPKAPAKASTKAPVAAKPAAVAKPKAPVAAKPAAVAKPKAPVAAKPAAVAKPKAPVAAKPAAVAKPKVPVAAKPAAVAKPKVAAKPAAKVKAPIAAKPAAIAKTKAPVAAKLPAKTVPAAPTKATAASKPGMEEQLVSTLESVLVKNKVTFKGDGKFGPKLQAAWRALAAKNKLDGTIDRAGPNQAWIVPGTFTVLWQKSLASPVVAPKVGVKPVVPAVKPKTTSVKPAVAKATATAPAAETTATKTKVSVGTAQDLLRRLGAKIGRDGKFGPITAAAWGVAAKKLGVNPLFSRIDGFFAYADAQAYTAIANAANAPAQAPTGAPPPSAQQPEVQQKMEEERGVPPSVPEQPSAPATQEQAAAQDESDPVQKAAQGLIAQATLQMPVLLVQQGLLMANETPSRKGQFAAVQESGVWDDATKTGLLNLFKVAPPYIPVWDASLATLLNDDGSQVKLPPKQGAELVALAKLWVDLKARKQAEAPQTQEASVGPAPSPISPVGPTQTPYQPEQRTPEPIDIKPNLPDFQPEQMPSMTPAPSAQQKPATELPQENIYGNVEKPFYEGKPGVYQQPPTGTIYATPPATSAPIIQSTPSMAPITLNVTAPATQPVVMQQPAQQAAVTSGADNTGLILGVVGVGLVALLAFGGSK